MKANNTLILWNGADPELFPEKSPPAGSLAVGPLEHPGCYWADRFNYAGSGGAAYVDRRTLKPAEQEREVMLDWYQLVYTFGLHPYIVHRAFLLIDEYQTIIKRIGCGPAKEETGHDPNVCYGRCSRLPLPELRVIKTGHATHFWPAQ